MIVESAGEEKEDNDDEKVAALLFSRLLRFSYFFVFGRVANAFRNEVSRALASSSSSTSEDDVLRKT